MKTVSLEDVRAVMAVLAQIREKEAVIDDIIGPVEEMYHMLGRYEARFASQSHQSDIPPRLVKAYTYALLQAV